MKITVEHFGQVVCIKPECDQLDMSNHEEFRKLISDVLKKEHYVILDLENVQFLDSSAASVLLYCVRTIAMHKGKLRICNPSEAVDVTLKLLRMQNLAGIYHSRSDAIKAFEIDIQKNASNKT